MTSRKATPGELVAEQPMRAELPRCCQAWIAEQTRGWSHGVLRAAPPTRGEGLGGQVFATRK